MSMTQKPLEVQISDRWRRAEEQLPLYSVRLLHAEAFTKDGKKLQNVVAAVRRKHAVRPGEVLPCYTVNQFGCNCPDALHAREAGIDRQCKHEIMVSLTLANYTLMDEDLSVDPPVDGWYPEYSEPVEEPKPRMSREEYARRLAQDFGDQ